MNKLTESYYNVYSQEPEYTPDRFDIVLEYLVAEGYADTNQEALMLMSELDEEVIEEIISENQAMLKFKYQPGRSFSIGGEGSGTSGGTDYRAGLDVTRYAAGREVTPSTVSQGVQQAAARPGATGQTSRPVGAKTGVTGYANVSGGFRTGAAPQQPETKQTTDSTKPDPTDPKKTDPKKTDPRTGKPIVPRVDSGRPVEPVRPVETKRPVEPVRPLETVRPAETALSQAQKGVRPMMPGARPMMPGGRPY